jgi:hypothetical protein
MKPTPVQLLWLLMAAVCSLFVACGGGGSTAATNPDTAPSIATQPVSQTVAAGSAVSFSVSATGTAPLAYQWRKAGVAIGGATAASFSIAAAATADAGAYDVVVSNAVGSVTSAAATLSVTGGVATAPVITTQPLAQTVTAGSAVSFSVTASGTAPLSFQWRKDGTAITGATAASLSLAAVTAGDAGSYSVVVTNSAGSATSAAALLTVQTASTGTLAAEATAAAQAFVATLSTTQQTAVLLPWDLANARRWSNLPAAMSARNGLSWGNLSTAQKTAARALILTAVGNTGNALHLGMQAADDVLVSQYGASSSYGNGNYHIALYGTPSASGFWVLQLTGHHLTYHVAFNGGVRSQTPMFLGIEPKGAFTLGGTAYDPMQTQREAVAALGTALTSVAGAALSGTYADLVIGPGGGGGGLEGTYPKSYPTGTSNRGVLFGALSTADQEKVRAVIRAYVNTSATENATELLAAYLADAALAQTYVAYAGAGDINTNGSYFRIDGPRVWIEYSVQRGILINTDIHPHTIWRDKSGDFGGRCCS